MYIFLHEWCAKTASLRGSECIWEVLAFWDLERPPDLRRNVEATEPGTSSVTFSEEIPFTLSHVWVKRGNWYDTNGDASYWNGTYGNVTLMSYPKVSSNSCLWHWKKYLVWFGILIPKFLWAILANKEKGALLVHHSMVLNGEGDSYGAGVSRLGRTHWLQGLIGRSLSIGLG